MPVIGESKRKASIRTGHPLAPSRVARNGINTHALTHAARSLSPRCSFVLGNEGSRLAKERYDRGGGRSTPSPKEGAGRGEEEGQKAQQNEGRPEWGGRVGGGGGKER